MKKVGDMIVVIYFCVLCGAISAWGFDKYGKDGFPWIWAIFSTVLMMTNAKLLRLMDNR